MRSPGEQPPQRPRGCGGVRRRASGAAVRGVGGWGGPAACGRGRTCWRGGRAGVARCSGAKTGRVCVCVCVVDSVASATGVSVSRVSAVILPRFCRDSARFTPRTLLTVTHLPFRAGARGQPPAAHGRRTGQKSCHASAAQAHAPPPCQPRRTPPRRHQCRHLIGPTQYMHARLSRLSNSRPDEMRHPGDLDLFRAGLGRPPRRRPAAPSTVCELPASESARRPRVL